jgi:hypothetical protein
MKWAKRPFPAEVLIDDDLTVKPGTPLEMNIGLDRRSADIYGVMVSNMEVTDTRDQEEILILNGYVMNKESNYSVRAEVMFHILQ